MADVSEHQANSEIDRPARAPGSRRELRRLLLGAGQGAGLTLRGVLLFYVALLVYFAVEARNFMTYANWVDVVATGSVVLIVSLGQALTIISGGFDLSVGGVVPLGAVVFAELTSSSIPAVPAMVIVVLVGTAVGVFNAFVVGQLRVNPLIATLGTLSVTGGIAFTIANGVTVQVPIIAGFLANNGPATIPYYVFLAICLMLLVHFLLRNTVLGRRIYVVGGNPEAARLAGIRVGSVQLAVYGLSGALASLGGVVYASQLLAAAGDVGSDLTLTSIAAVVLGGAALTGGIGGVPGTVLGVLVLGTVADGMNLMRVPAFYQEIVTGGVLLAAVAFAQVQGRLVGRES